MNLDLDRSTWERVRFGDVVRQGKESVDPTDGTVERYIAGEHMDTDDLRIHRWGDVDDGYLGPAFHRRFHAGQVLYGSRRTYLRKVAVVEFDGVCANTTFVLETKDQTRLSQRFLPFLMSSEPFHAFAILESKGSVNPYINFSDLARFEFDLPPLDEQQRIADLLWAAQRQLDDAKGVSVKALQVEREYLRRALLLDGGRAKIEDLGEVLMGRQKAPQYRSGESMRPYLRVANVGDNRLNLSDVAEMDFPGKDAERFRLNAGDILVSEGQSRELVGQAARVPADLEGHCFQNTLIRLRPNADRDSEFVYAQVRALYYSGHFSAIASQTTSIAHLGVRRFAETEVTVPDDAKRVGYLNGLAAVGPLLDAARANVLAAAELKAATLQEVFA